MPVLVDFHIACFLHERQYAHDLEFTVARIVEIGVLLRHVDIAVGAFHVALFEHCAPEIKFRDSLAFGRFDVKDRRLNLVIEVFVLVSGLGVKVSEYGRQHGLDIQTYVMTVEETFENRYFLRCFQPFARAESHGILVVVGIRGGYRHHRIAILSRQAGVFVGEIRYGIIAEVGEEPDTQIIEVYFLFCRCMRHVDMVHDVDRICEAAS